MRGTFDLPWRLKMHACASECTKTMVDIKMPITNRTWKVDEVPVEAVESTRSAVLVSLHSLHASSGERLTSDDNGNQKQPAD